MKDYLQYALLLILCALLIASCRECTGRGHIMEVNLNAMNDTIKYFKNSIGTLTASKTTIQLSNSQLKSAIAAKDKELSRLMEEFSEINNIVKSELQVKIDTIKVPFVAKVPYSFTRSGKLKNRWYGFGYEVNENGFVVDSLAVPLALSVITGKKRKWIFGKEVLCTDVTIDNPYVQVKNIYTAEVRTGIPWFKKWYVWAALGFTSGIFISK